MSGPADTPQFSVVVPTFGRPDRLLACLQGLARQSTEMSFEVIVADDGGEPPAEHVEHEWSGRLDLTVLRQTNEGPGSARNLGASHARGPYLVFLDDDCVPAPSWLDNFDSSALERGGLVGGCITNGLPHNPFATASHLITEFAYRYYRDHPSAERFFTTNNLAASREVFEALGGFDTSIPAATAEDKDLCDRWQASGRELVYAEGAVVSHEHRLGLRTFVRQHYRYGRGILCFRLLRRARASAQRLPLRPEPASFYMRLVVFPMLELGGLHGIGISLLIALSQVATVLGALHGAIWDLPKLRKSQRDPTTLSG